MSEQNLYKMRGTLKIDQPATYSIQVAGYLDAYWSNRLGGLEISNTAQDENMLITTLSGALIDQAALFGVLKALYDMRLPLLSVKCLEANCNRSQIKRMSKLNGSSGISVTD
jgi:hypothetical protein